MTLTSPSFLTEIKTEDDLLPPGAKSGTVPTDLSQATGLERLELIGKMQGIDIFDMRPLDASRKGMIPTLSVTSRVECALPSNLSYAVESESNRLFAWQEHLTTPSLSRALVTSSTPVAPVTPPTPTRSSG